MTRRHRSLPARLFTNITFLGFAVLILVSLMTRGSGRRQNQKEELATAGA